MKKITAILLSLLLALTALPAVAEYTAQEPAPDALMEDYFGPWICVWAEVAGNMFEAETDLEILGMDTILTLIVDEDGMAAFTGIPELSAEKMPLTFLDGAMLFEPEAGFTVLTLQLLQDGVIRMTFNMVPGAPTLYLCRDEPADDGLLSARHLAGGWEIVSAEARTLPEEAQIAFEKATAGLVGAVYTPVALLSTQLVAGTNYCILCQITPVVPDPVPTWNLIYIYADLHGGAEITNIWEIYVDRHTEPAI